MVLGEGLPGREIGSLRESRHCQGIRLRCELRRVFEVLSVSAMMVESEWSCPPQRKQSQATRAVGGTKAAYLVQARVGSNTVGYGVRGMGIWGVRSEGEE